MIKFINYSYFKIIKTISKRSNQTLREISEDSGLDMARISPLMREWIQDKIVTKDDSGDRYLFTITKKGIKIKEKLQELENIFEEKEQPKKVHEEIAEKPREKVDGKSPVESIKKSNKPKEVKKNDR